jgi:predicted CXXCH cytochrome family protein
MQRSMHSRSSITLVVPLLLAIACAPVAWGQIVGSKHNLSLSGTGTIKSTTETEICKFCHLSHKAVGGVPVWGHQLSSATYTPYTSGTISSTVTSTITGATKLCLSCHDGQVAVNAMGNGQTPTMASGANYVTGASSLGTTLSSDHPVSFVPDTSHNNQIVSPSSNSLAWGQVHLDDAGKVQCTSCHDPHADNIDATCKKFLTASNKYAALCTTCHTKRYWSSSSAHKSSVATFTSGQGQHTGYTTVTENGCESCHKPHKATQSKQLLNGSEEAACVPCHKGSANGGNTANNISNTNSGPFTKTYTHPTFTTSGKHTPVTLAPRTDNPSETVANLSGSNRHAECQDCHNPHAAGTRSGKSGSHYNDGTSFTPTSNVASSLDLTGVWGVEPGTAAAWTAPTQGSYTRVDPATKEYQICLKCHSAFAYNTSPPTSPSSGTNGITNETDQAQEFNPNNLSFHAVATAAIAGVKGSYNAPWAATSRMYCTDCHGKENTNTGWTAPTESGPHGSNNAFILRGAWTTTTGSGSTTDLCFKCHSYSAMQNGSPANTKFSKGNYADDMHQKHLFGVTPAKKCMNCHSPIVHGGKRASLIALVGDGAPYELVGTSKIKTWTRNSGNYEMTNCTTGTGCH